MQNIGQTATTAATNTQKLNLKQLLAINTALSEQAKENTNLVLMPALSRPFQEAILRQFTQHYNNNKRFERLKAKDLISAGKMDAKNLKAEFYQLIKANHFQLMLEIVQQVIGQMMFENTHFCMTGGQRKDPAEPYHLFTNNQKLANNLGVNSDRTIRYQLKRLLTCGFLMPVTDEKGITRHNINHGKTADYELLINPQLLAIFDQAQPEKGAQYNTTGKTVECGFPDDLRKKLPPIEVKRTHKETIESGTNVENANAIPPFADVIEKTNPKKGPREKENSDLSNLDISEKNEPSPGAAANPLTMRLEVFLTWATQQLCPDYQMYPAVRQKILNDLHNHFLHGYTDNQERFEHRMVQFVAAINKQKRYIHQHPNNFALVPSEYFDPNYKPKRKTDLSRFTGALAYQQYQYTQEKRKAQREAMKKRYAQLRKVHRVCCLPFTQPSKYNLHEVYMNIKKNAPQYLFIMDAMLDSGSTYLEFLDYKIEG